MTWVLPRPRRGSNRPLRQAVRAPFPRGELHTQDWRNVRARWMQRRRLTNDIAWFLGAREIA